MKPRDEGTVMEEQEQEQCAICLNEFEDFNNDATLLNCGCQQLYHNACIWEWLWEKRNFTCPICRFNFARATKKFAKDPR